MAGIGTTRGVPQPPRRFLLRVLLLAGFVVAGWLLGATAASADAGTGAVHAEPVLPGTGRTPIGPVDDLVEEGVSVAGIAAVEDTVAAVGRDGAAVGDTVSDVGGVVGDTVERTVSTVEDTLAPLGGPVLPTSPAPAPAPVEPPAQELPQLEHVSVPAPSAASAPPPMSRVTLPAPLLASSNAPAGQPGAPSAGSDQPGLPVPAAPPCSGIPGGSAIGGGSASATVFSATTGVVPGAGGDELATGTLGAVLWRAERPSTSPD